MMTALLINRLAASLQELADELQAEIGHRYGGSQYQYSIEQRRYDRDMEPVLRARNLLAEWEDRKRRWQAAE
jgi:hypothetical protein